jgi:tetratricopeptide (TPR) repeat protein
MLGKAKFTFASGILTIAAVGACGGTPVAAPSGSAKASPVASAGRLEVERLQRVGADLNVSVEALNKNDVKAAQQAFAKFDDGWNSVEVYVKARSAQLYAQIEDAQGNVDKQLLESASPVASQVLPPAQQVQTSYAEAVKLSQSGAPLNPVLDQLAELREVRIALRKTIAALRKGDVAAAKASYKEFDSHWDDVENYVKDRSGELYRGIESDMAKVTDALLKPAAPNASEALPLAEALLNRYNEAVRLLSEGLTTA